MIEVQSFKHVKNLIEMSPMENIVGYLFSLLMGKIGRGSIIAERTGVGSNQLSSKLYRYLPIPCTRTFLFCHSEGKA